MKDLIKNYYKPLLIILLINMPPLIKWIVTMTPGNAKWNFNWTSFGFLDYDWSISLPMSTLVGIVYRMGKQKIIHTENLNPNLERRNNVLLENDSIILEALSLVINKEDTHDIRVMNGKISNQKEIIKKELKIVIDSRNIKIDDKLRAIENEISKTKKLLEASTNERNNKLYKKILVELNTRKAKLGVRL